MTLTCGSHMTLVDRVEGGKLIEVRKRILVF
jgi:hypothetical protein